MQTSIPSPGSQQEVQTPPARGLAPVTVVILTFNEEQNLPACLASVASWAGQIVIVDSGSTDRTREIARDFGATLLSHPFETHSKQWRWALDNLPAAPTGETSEWILGLDADQRISHELAEEIRDLLCPCASAAREGNQPAEIDGYYIKRRQVFQGRWIRHGGYYPKYLLKLFRRDRVLFDEHDLVDHHFHVRGKVGKLRNDLIEDNRKEDDINFWIQKHCRYAVALAREELRRNSRESESPIVPRLWGTPDQRVLWLKHAWYRLPLFVRPFLYFFYRYFLRLGFLDGKQGFVFHFLQGFWYRLLVDIHLDQLRREPAARNGESERH
ncbi:MAG TPA: glycosyltransferase family 2 protein [Pirellulales bacterium]|nr:glycosyltransferase family 2 protein [Pirellulales bacterium]